MTDDELMGALDGLFAYDTGCTSGIHDPLLKERVKAELQVGRREGQLWSDRVSRLARELYLTDEKIAQGYGLEDMRQFANWLDDEMWPTR